MPDWTCAKCGVRIEGFSWDDKPWNGHVCSDIRKEIGLQPDAEDSFPPKERRTSLTDFLM